eukprot:gene8004-8202_t
MHAKAAVQLGRRMAAAFSRSSSSRQGSGLEVALHWQALGLTMAALLQLSELVEQSGNAQDALRLLREAACSSLHKSDGKAQLLLQEAIVNLGNGLCKLLEKSGGQQQQRGWLQHVPAGCGSAANMILWKTVDLRAKLQLQLSHILMGSEGPQLVGFGSNSGHSNLMAEFAGAADDLASGLQELCVSGNPTSDSGNSSSKNIRGGRKGRAGKATAVQPAAGEGGTSRPSSKLNSTRKKPTGDVAQPSSTALHLEYQEPAVWLSATLKLLPHVAHRPLLLKQACSLLSSFLQSQGAVHSAAMFLQLKMGAATTEASSDQQCEQLLLCRVVCPPAGATQHNLPLILQLAGPTPGTRREACRSAGSSAANSMCQLLQQLSGILDDSAASMQCGAAASTAEQRSSWWRQRIDQDSRLQQLLVQVDQHWLGPWRCLLMHSQPWHVEQAGSAAAEAFVAECFDCVLDDTPRQLLAQLVSALLLHLDCCSSDEVSKAVVDLCQLAQQRSDGPHIANLVGKMTEAFQRVQAAAGQGPKIPTRSLSASTPKASDASLSAGRICPQAAAAVASCDTSQAIEVAATPRAAASMGIPGLKARSSRKPTQSRLLGMQRASVPTPASHQPPLRPADAAQPSLVLPDVDGLAQGMADKLHLSTPMTAAARSRIARQVRFAAADTLDAMARDQEAVPASIARHAQIPWESCPGLQQQNMYRCPNMPIAAAASLSSRGRGGRAVRHFQLVSGFFLLNPEGDLPATQNTFEAWLRQLGLQGLVGIKPSAKQLTEALSSHDVFLYFGHGGGEQYVPLAMLKQLHSCASSLLMGCSSGRLQRLGLYESSGTIWAYLLAGCPAAVANLWDVTDRDIDRFAQAMLEQWLRGSSTSRSRQSCKLRWLVGAAPVCYGLPGWLS